jgi:hypothetical protein
MRCRIEKCVKFSDSYRSQEPEVLYDSEKLYRVTNDGFSHCHDTTSSYYICWEIRMREQTLC